MSKYTPGPWLVESATSEALHDIAMANPPPGEGNPVVLATVYHDEDRGTCPTLEQANANARLIAAAPDLLEACKAAISPLRQAANELDSGYYARAADDLAAAIAKAEGR